MKKLLLLALGAMFFACSPNKKAGNRDVSFLPNGDTNMTIAYVKPNEIAYFVCYENNKPALNFYSLPGLDSLTEATLYPFDGNQKFFVYYPIQTFKEGMELHLFSCDSSFTKPLQTILKRQVLPGEVIPYPKKVGFFKSVLVGKNATGQTLVYEASH